MKILHYTLGIPPYRTGGLTKYSVDLMEEQCKKNTVFLLFPGSGTLFGKSKIKYYKKFNGINVYEYKNPLPVSLLGGISNVGAFMKESKEAFCIIKDFIQEIKPDIIHIHTLMGLPKEFFDVCKGLGIKCVFTTHDYFGICPKTTLIDFKGDICVDYCSGEKCIRCNENSYSMNLIKLMQSNTYRMLKDNFLFKRLRWYKKKKINSSFVPKQKSEIKIDKGLSSDYIKLREYYINMLKSIDFIHFNSRVTKEIYSNYGIQNGDVISIAHKSIEDNRYLKKYNKDEKLKILYLGPMEKHKGIFLLIDSLSDIININKEWMLSIYGTEIDGDFGALNDNIQVKGRYNYGELKTIIENHDVLVVPSIWYETFGFILMEGLSFGMPVITTKLVGSKDLIVNNETGIILNPDKKELSETIMAIIEDRSILSQINKNIVESQINFSFEGHVEAILNMYDEVLEV